MRLHGSWGTGFKAPTFNELYFPGFGNPDLAPETSTGGDLGIELRGLDAAGGERWRADVTGFANDVDDLIDFDLASLRAENVARARIRGVESLLAWRPAAALEAQATYTWTDSEDRATGRPLARRPEHRGSLTALWHPAGPWDASLVVTAVADRIDSDGTPMADYQRVDLTAGREILPPPTPPSTCASTTCSTTTRPRSTATRRRGAWRPWGYAGDGSSGARPRPRRSKDSGAGTDLAIGQWADLLDRRDGGCYDGSTDPTRDRRFHGDCIEKGTAMRPQRESGPVPVLVLLVLLTAVPAWAGDPIPDVDVILEQIPGGMVRVDSPTGGFDSIDIEVGKRFAGVLDAAALPEGWALETKGKAVHLSGPAQPYGRPVRLVLSGRRDDAATATDFVPRRPREAHAVAPPRRADTPRAAPPGHRQPAGPRHPAEPGGAG